MERDTAKFLPPFRFSPWCLYAYYATFAFQNPVNNYFGPSHLKLIATSRRNPSHSLDFSLICIQYQAIIENSWARPMRVASSLLGPGSDRPGDPVTSGPFLYCLGLWSGEGVYYVLLRNEASTQGHSGMLRMRTHPSLPRRVPTRPADGDTGGSRGRAEKHGSSAIITVFIQFKKIC